MAKKKAPPVAKPAPKDPLVQFNVEIERVVRDELKALGVNITLVIRESMRRELHRQIGEREWRKMYPAPEPKVSGRYRGSSGHPGDEECWACDGAGYFDEDGEPCATTTTKRGARCYDCNGTGRS